MVMVIGLAVQAADGQSSGHDGLGGEKIAAQGRL